MLCPLGNFLYKDSWVAVGGWGKCEQGFRRMAARNKSAGIRSLFYGMGKGKAGIESLSVSRASFEGGPGDLSLSCV